jgi:hypothetical protein
MGIEIGGKKVGGGKLGAFAEELGTGLEVGDTAVDKVKGIALEGGNFYLPFTFATTSSPVVLMIPSRQLSPPSF